MFVAGLGELDPACLRNIGGRLLRAVNKGGRICGRRHDRAWTRFIDNFQKMMDKFSTLIPQSLLATSGKVFYSGRAAFSAPSKLYMLGVNPGGSPQEHVIETIGWHTEKVLKQETPDWSAYRDEQWQGAHPGTSGMQPRVLHMLRELNLEPGRVPASNVVFLRSARENNLKTQFKHLAELCWPFHRSVIEDLGVRVVLCFGQGSGNWVCKKLNAKTPSGEFIENNNRRWRSNAFINSEGIAVVIATHPSIADWTTPAADPSPLVKRMLAR